MTPSSSPSSAIWQRLLQASWQRRVVPGLTVIGLMVVLRLLGVFQGIEWKALDSFLRWRPAEPTSDRLLIVGINEADIQQIGTYPIPDGVLAALITELQQHQPRAIGLDLFRDLPIEPGSTQLNQLMAASPQLFGIEKIISSPVLPPPALPPEQVGFNDFALDDDGFVRRAFMGAFPPPLHPEPDRFRLSFPLLLAEAYLAEADLSIENGRRNPENMRFGDTELSRFQPDTGGYVGADASGVQMLINTRSGRSPFTVVSLSAVLAGEVEAALIRDRVVLIGVTSLSQKDLVNSGAVNTFNPGLVYGVEMHAHITSQVLSAVLDDRPAINVWPDPWEYLWIIGWGAIGMALVGIIARPAWYLLTVGLVGLGLFATSYLVLWLGGWWLPVMPTLVAFTLNGLVLPGFYLYDQTLRSRIAARQRVIEETYDAIHNGPLQSLALLLKQKADLDPTVQSQLADLNQELRTVYNRLQQESLPAAEQLHLGGGKVVDLRDALHEVLYEVYVATLKRDFPGFASLKFQVVKFEPMQEAGLPGDDRRSLCRLLEEMLCNVGKHAVGAKRLTIACYATETDNIIRVEDNGKGAAAPNASAPNAATGGRGTQQAQDLAQRLGGTYQRQLTPKGTSCELRWPTRRPRFRWLRSRS
ncbi:MAG: CHASE2 domain-containing protein [Leptolyngbya sp. SIOISBB]|nr:CHASE2 domain-containing protein [Leptolyngbya sp. SIOISBB]